MSTPKVSIIGVALRSLPVRMVLLALLSSPSLAAPPPELAKDMEWCGAPFLTWLWDKSAASVSSLQPLQPACAQLVRPSVSGSVPPCPYADPNGCPFEGCQYGKWKARAATPLYRSVDASDVVAVVQPGEIVTAARGIVFSVPCPTRVLYPNPGFTKDEIVFRVTYLGEGAYRYWREGRLIDGWIEDCSMLPAPSPSCWSKPLIRCTNESIWWVEMRTASGAVGWTRDTGNFSGKHAYSVD